MKQNPKLKLIADFDDALWLDVNLLRAAGYEDWEIEQMQECDELDNIEEECDDED